MGGAGSNFNRRQLIQAMRAEYRHLMRGDSLMSFFMFSNPQQGTPQQAGEVVRGSWFGSGRGLGGDFQLLPWIGDCVEVAFTEQFDGVGDALRLPRIGLAWRRIGGPQGVQRLHQVDPAHPVDGRMVHLGDHREAALGDAGDIIEPLDHGEFPRRAIEIERTGMDARGLNEADMVEGAQRSTLTQLADWTSEADKVLVF